MLKRLLRHVMIPAARYPLDPRAVFILGLSIMAGVPLLFSDATPGSIEHLLPGWAVIMWGIALVFGAALTLFGMSRQTVDGIIAEQIGSVIVGCAAIIYSFATLLSNGEGAVYSFAVIFGYGLSSLWRYGQLQALLTQTKKIVDEVKADQATENGE